MSDLGQFLKQTRLKKNLSIDEVQEITKIRKRYLEAIESGEYNILPGTFYARAFIKSYAEVLELDTEQIFTEYAHEIPQTSSATVETVVPKRKRNVKTTSPKAGKWLSRILLYSFILFVCFAVYMAAVNYLDNLGEQATEPPEITGPTGDGKIENPNQSNGEEPDTNTEQTANGLEKEEENMEPEEPEVVWTRLESNRRNTTFEYSGPKEIILTLQAKDRVWYRLSDPKQNKEIDSTELQKDAEKEWDLTGYDQVVLRLGNPPGANLLVNGQAVDISGLPQPHDLIINFKSVE